MDVNLVLPGTKVRYRGSLTEYHGEMEVVDFHTPIGGPVHDYDVIRYALKYGPGWQDYLRNVRPESFIVLTSQEQREAWETRH